MAAARKTGGKSPKDVLAFIKQNKLQIVDVKFIDMPGMWQHFSVPAEDFTADAFSEGLGFDGSSIRGFQKIQESDMILIPDANTAIVDPVCEIPTLSIICNVFDPVTRKAYSRDPRYVAQKAEAFLKSTGIGDSSFWGPEAEFFIFDDVRYGGGTNSSFYYVDSTEGNWNTGRKEDGANLGFKIRPKEGYFPVPPNDTFQDLRSEMLLTMRAAGVPAEMQHHEVGTAGQAEIDIRFDTLVRMADHLMVYKYVIKNVARKHGYTATFMPKPLFGDNGSGMHCHQSIWKAGKPVFFDAKGYAQLSKTALHYVGGLLKHAPSLLGLCAPTTNSYRRLVPGFEAPVNLALSQRNRSASCRIPMYSNNPKAKRVEFRCPDPSCNPYLAFAAMLMAGLDGVKNKIEPLAIVDKDLYDLEPEEAAKIQTVPGSLSEALDALEADHDYLLKGDVFTPDLIEQWLNYKRANEVDPIRLRPHPHEFFLYYDI